MTTDPLILTAAFILGTIGVARAARLVTSDNWPPMESLRLRWLTWTAQTEARSRWADLLTCPFCFAPYAAAVNLTWGVLALSHLERWWADAWWIVNAWAVVSYLAAMIVVRDEPVDES